MKKSTTKKPAAIPQPVEMTAADRIGEAALHAHQRATGQQLRAWSDIDDHSRRAWTRRGQVAERTAAMGTALTAAGLECLGMAGPERFSVRHVGTKRTGVVEFAAIDLDDKAGFAKAAADVAAALSGEEPKA